MSIKRGKIRKGIKLRYRRHVLSKWAKTKALLAHSDLRNVVPETRRMNRQNLRTMLEKLKMVYIKPDKGTFGNGVMRVELRGDNKMPYRYQHGVAVKKFSTFDAMYDSLRKTTRNKSYLVQKGIHLLKYKKRRFDLRVMVQQTPKKIWETTGVIGRVAHPKKIVTNFHNGGTLMPVERLLKAYMPENEREEYINDLRALGLKLAKQLHKTFRGIKEIGADIGLDRQYKPWVLEVNTSPDPYIFRKLKDKSIFRKIVKYARAYGRIK